MRGIILMVGGLFLLTLNDAAAKWLTEGYPTDYLAPGHLYSAATRRCPVIAGGLHAFKPTAFEIRQYAHCVS